MNGKEKIITEIWHELQDVPKEDCPQIERRLLEQVDKPVLKRFIHVLFDLRERL